MAGIEWVPLDLWRASKLQVETKEVQRAWAEAVESGDEDSMRAIRAAIEMRMEALENFYVAHASDQRAVLFEKQRLSLRALLQSHAAAVHRAAMGSPSRAAAGAATAAASGSPGAAWGSESDFGASGALASGGTGMSDDSRLDLASFTAWLNAGGKRQVPGLHSKPLDQVFDAVAASSDRPDGMVSVREVRFWFFNVFRKGGWRPRAESATKPAPAPRGHKPLYSFEEDSLARGGDGMAMTSSSAADLAATTASVGLPGSSLLFEVVLTKKEFDELKIRRRQMAARAKDRVRRLRARELSNQAKAEKASHGGLFTPELSRDALQKDSTFVDADKMERIIFRKPEPASWVAPADFRTQ